MSGKVDQNIQDIRQLQKQGSSTSDKLDQSIQDIRQLQVQGSSTFGKLDKCVQDIRQLDRSIKNINQQGQRSYNSGSASTTQFQISLIILLNFLRYL